MSGGPITSLLEALGSGEVELVDLTQPLGEDTPLIRMQEPLANMPPVRLHELSDYDERGPNWKWHWLELGEHAGTHFDAPIHWVTGRDGDDTASIPAQRLIGPAVVIDCSQRVAHDPDYLLTIDDVRAFETEHGPLPEGGWLLVRSGWGARLPDPAAFLNDGHSPGTAPECARWLAEETGIVGIGVETVGIDAGIAPQLEPRAPVHFYFLGAGKYGVTQLANLDRLPATGALLIVAPLRLVGGTGSPVRALALIPRA